MMGRVCPVCRAAWFAQQRGGQRPWRTSWPGNRRMEGPFPLWLTLWAGCPATHPACSSSVLPVAGERLMECRPGWAPAMAVRAGTGRTLRIAFRRPCRKCSERTARATPGTIPGQAPGMPPKSVAGEQAMRVKCQPTVRYVSKTPTRACRQSPAPTRLAFFVSRTRTPCQSRPRV